MIMSTRFNKYLLMILSVGMMLAACKDADEALQPEGAHTYRMRLVADITTYDDATRAAAYTFQDKDQVYVLFQQGTATISGTAVYDASKDEWTLTPSQTLKDTDESRCQLAFFLAAGSTSSSAITLTQQTRIYTDAQATYQLADGMLTIQGQLSPALGRIRFRGSAGQKCTVSGLAFASTFSLKDHTFSLSPSKFTATCGADGYTPYYYAAFADADKRQLTFELSTESGLRRSFGAGVLQAGTSGYVTIPMADSHEGWTLVNLGSGGEITFATISKPAATNIRSARAALAAVVTSAGGGRISASGFVIATHASPTRNDRTLDCGTATTMETTVSGLTPETTYYVRAFAVNEAGTTYSEEISFRTIAKKDDSNDLERDEWPTDEDWNDAQSTVANVDRETWPADEDWN
ncbi:MAG: fibronectin type III domain-containing protein [Bacteroidaceae bacterium]|nr:fibronectin type III domain-containing protein [Bacteroidaceae bacterium]